MNFIINLKGILMLSNVITFTTVSFILINFHTADNGNERWNVPGISHCGQFETCSHVSYRACYIKVQSYSDFSNLGHFSWPRHDTTIIIGMWSEILCSAIRILPTLSMPSSFFLSFFHAKSLVLGLFPRMLYTTSMPHKQWLINSTDMSLCAPDEFISHVNRPVQRYF